jgi:hypothetical protein
VDCIWFPTARASEKNSRLWTLRKHLPSILQHLICCPQNSVELWTYFKAHFCNSINQLLQTSNSPLNASKDQTLAQLILPLQVPVRRAVKLRFTISVSKFWYLRGGSRLLDHYTTRVKVLFPFVILRCYG